MMDWGVPDWRDAAAYPATGDALTIREWWWQFTRRRPDYRQLWQRLWPELQNFVEANSEWCRVLTEDEGSLNSAIETRWARVHLAGYLHELRTRFRLKGLADPRIGDRNDDQLRHLHYAEDRAAAVEYYSLEAVREDQQDGFVLYRFNLDRPIDEQLEDAKKYLSDMQRHAKGKAVEWRRHRSKWPLYLRALDAKDAGASQPEMADVFWTRRNQRRADGKIEKPPQSARDTYAQACELRDNFKI